MRNFFENNMATVAQVKEAGFFHCSTWDPLWNNVLPSSQRERRVSRLNKTGNNTTGWARRLTALLITACLVMAMALPVYAEVDLLPDVPDEVELLEDEPGTASGEDTIEQLPDANAPPKQEAATPVPDAATPEPEQSAEPEQPAPTETPEPTAEPTPTPEPTATATATPVPTVTPTATPEPTEQPQKMYAARSGDNVQAVSAPEGVPDTYTLYFAVPDGWTDCKKVKIHAIVGQNETSDRKYYLDMQEADKTDDGRKIYSAVLNKDDHYPNKGLGGLEFCGYKDDTLTNDNPTYKVTIVQVDDYNNRPWDQWISFDPTDERYIKGNYYDGNKKGGLKRDDWITYTVSHKHFANKPMAFENKTSETLTNVKAWFYEPKEGELKPVGDPIPLNSTESGSGIASGSTAKVTIPDVLCSYVKFTWYEGDSQKYSKIYNFYGEDVSGDDEKSFTYSDTSNCFIYTGAGNERWGIENSVLIYYDATFSKLPTTGTGDTSGDYSIPKDPKDGQSTVYYRLKGKNKESIGGPMSRIKDTDCYAADVPEGYTQIVFSSHQLSSDDITTTCGDTTNWVDIPSNVTEPCFYADTNDDAVYSKGTRGGYWAKKGTLRDAEKWKNLETKVVDIKSAAFTEEADTKYVTSTLYDYYTDYELNGKNRYNYGSYTDASHRTWVTFREFDQALSDYYEKAGAQYPIYTGHFQPAGYPEFSLIADTLKLFGYDKTNQQTVNRFMAINNSQYNEDQSNGNTHYDYAYQGLVANTTNADGAPLLNGTTKATVEPHFNKDFLLGENSKKAKLGEVYENVKFPFTKVKNLFNNETNVDYWCFDSKDTTLYLKQDSGQNSDSKYFLQESTTNRDPSKNVSALSNPKDPYGYFPFNETATPGVFSTYNYGFGTKLQMDFTLTDDGMVETEKADGTTEKTSIKFFFSGDDDVWVFIDGQLALDVGGAHGEVSGLLEFGETSDKSQNSVTAYVSRVKKGGTSDKEDKDERTVKSPVKTVTYNKEDIKFYAEGTTLTFDKGKKHTLTMYYMERGMWESNMAVAFNFPDNNELQVQKKVDLSNVTDDDFKKCFTGRKIFNFTIQNQATHYGTKDAVGPDESGTPSKKVDLAKDVLNIAPATTGKENDYIFKKDTNPGPDSKTNTEQVLHWYARYTDTKPVSDNRDKRYGILTLKDPIDIKDMRFLTFQVYVSKKDGGELSLNNLYLELLDNQNLLDPQKSPGQKGSLGTTGINGATYGSVELKTDQWVTVKLDLHKMKEQGGTDGKFSGKVTTIRVGDNYSRNIYFRNFTFIPKAKPRTMSGFTTDQKKIPDYHSVESGNLENAENAQYTSTIDNETQLVEGDGRFVLEAGEIVTFSDQFRRGSYISLKEELNQNLYDTTWTVYENGEAVKSTNPTNPDNVSHVTIGTPRPLDGQKDPPKGPDDGRTEKKGTGEEQPKENLYDGNKPSETNTIVFRSYKNPDETSSTLTKLKVKYVNKVKTGGLKIQKKAADDETLTGTYKFKVTFNNVGGEGLEDGDIIREYTIDMSDTQNPEHICTITGIPVGTRYTIEEVKPKDSRLQSVTITGGENNAHLISNDTMVEGVIVESADPNKPDVTAIFTNTQRKLINIEFDKHWIDAENKELKNQPSEIYIQLQRRPAGSKNDAEWQAVEYAGSKYVMVPHKDGGWKRTFSGLDQYQINAENNHTDYEYRIVEGTVDNNDQFIPANGTITIKGNTYVVTAEAEAKISEGGSTKDTEAKASTDGTITGGSGTIVLTNKLQNPKFVLDIIKKDAEKGKDGKEVPLSDVEFKLEKLVKNEGKTQWEVETSYTFDENNIGSITAITDEDGKITDKFKDLKPGRYRLTETKAHPGYNLLSKSIDIEFTQDGKYKIDDGTAQNATGTAASGYTVTLTVLNRKTPELPHTGADAPSLWLLIGLPLAVAGLLIFTFRYNRKGGRRH